MFQYFQIVGSSRSVVHLSSVNKFCGLGWQEWSVAVSWDESELYGWLENRSRVKRVFRCKGCKLGEAVLTYVKQLSKSAERTVNVIITGGHEMARWKDTFVCAGSPITWMMMKKSKKRNKKWMMMLMMMTAGSDGTAQSSSRWHNGAGFSLFSPFEE